jgi:protein-S-isoprenylcysteine O-methyltransferase Ste14
MLFVRITYALWVIQTVYLTITAFGAKRDTQVHLGQSFGLLFGLIAAGLLPRWKPLKFVNFAPVNPVVSVLGLLGTLAGMGTLVWARQTLGSNWSQTVSAKEDHELVTSGPYRLVRHPIYAGGLLASICSAVVSGGPFVFATLILGPLFLWRVGAEDRLMTQEFPEAYPAYIQRTRKLIPFIW